MGIKQNGIYGMPALKSTLRMSNSALPELGSLRNVYGPNFRFRAGPREAFFFSSPKGIHQFLFDKRGSVVRSPAYKMLSEHLGEGMITSDGEKWKKHRKAAQPSFSANYDSSHLPVMSAAARKALPLTMTDSYSDIDIQDLLDAYVITVSLEVFFGEHADSIPDDLGKKISRSNELIGKRVRSFYVPNWMPTRTNTEFAALGLAIADTIRVLVEHSVNKPGNLLSEIVERGGLDEDEAAAMAGNLFISSFETSSNALAWAISDLCESPDVQIELQQEMDAVFRRENLTEDACITGEQLAKLPLLRLFILESMRLHPSVWVYARETVEDISAEGFDIRKGALIMLSPYYLHRCPDVWGDDAAEFKLRRFENLNIRELAKDCKYLPFSVGERNCVGSALAINEISVGLVFLLRHFSVSRGESYSNEVKNSFTLKAANGMHVDLTKRS